MTDTINKSKRVVVQGIFLGIGLVFAFRLFSLQILNHDKFQGSSAVRNETINPVRGLIYDRNGLLVVENKPIYDVMVTVKDMEPMDTAHFCALLNIDTTYFKEKIKSIVRKDVLRKYRPEIFISQVSREDIISFEEHLFEFPGFSTKLNSVRNYPHQSAAHIFGDVGPISKRELKRDSLEIYVPQDNTGKSGIEMQYEEMLRGTKGNAVVLYDSKQRRIGLYKNGENDIPALAGKTLTSTIDIELQQYGESLMHGKLGSIVAIEPSTGEILAMVSAPSFNPNLLVGRERGENFRILQRDSNKTLYNRALTAQYPPGSTFKPLMGLAAVSIGAMDLNTGYGCGGGYRNGGHTVGCHGHVPIRNLNQAIQYSCNAYFCYSLKKFIDHPRYDNPQQAFDAWTKIMYGFGLGKKTAVDLPNEGSGHVPTTEYYNKVYRGPNWKASTIISLGIGQGETTVTMLQLANSYAILANKGFYFPPHLVRDNSSQSISEYNTRIETGIAPDYFQYTWEGLANAVSNGTARRAIIPEITVCGKTGTAENPHGEDHSLFAAFAPRENPKIAIAVVVENSGFGGTWAAPIASLMIEKYLTRTIAEERKPREKRILEANFINPN